VANYDSLVNAFASEGRAPREDRRHRGVMVPQRRDEPRALPVPVAWNGPARNLVFTGREQLLEGLRDRFLANGDAAARPVVLHGLGG
jgi:hypothetical protein